VEKTSEKIIRKKFPHIKTGILGNSAGLDPAVVNLFLQEILDDVERMEKKCDELEQELHAKVDVETMDLQDGANSAYANEEVAEEMKDRIERLETLERSYKRMIYMAEQEAKEIKKDAQQQSAKMLREAQLKADNLVKEANVRFDEKQRDYEMLTQRAEEVRQKLKHVAEYIESAV